MGNRLMMLAISISCATAWAVGDNTHEQGVRFAGPGFDEETALKPPQWVPWFGIKTWPLKSSDTYDSIGGPRQLKVTAKCPPEKKTDPLFAICYGTVREMKEGSFVPRTPVCNEPTAEGASVPLLAIRGKWNTSTGAFERDDQVVTFACAPTFKGRIHLYGFNPIMGQPGDPKSDLDSSLNLGVLAKCYFWGFAQNRTGDDGGAERFRMYQACLRAARAEYCGRGISQTQSGTMIQIYEPTEGHLGGLPHKVEVDTKKDCDAFEGKLEVKYKHKVKPCFEALWNDERAVCVSHARFEEMPVGDCSKEYRYTFTYGGKGGVPSDGKDGGTKGPQSLVQSLIPAGPSDIPVAHCQRGDYNEAASHSRIKNRSAINTLDGGVLGCQNDIPCP
jgi:hypothetical protein